MTGYIYAIHLLGSSEYRYVGMTATTIERRLQQHFTGAKRGKQYPVYDWLRKQEKELVQIVCLEACEELEDLENLEISWVSKLRSEGHRLLNLTEGGKGPRGHKWTEEQRAAHRERMLEVNNRPEKKLAPRNQKKGVPIHSQEQKELWSKQRTGTITGDKNPNYGKFGPEHPAYGRTLSEETKERLSEQRKGEKNPNYGRKLSEETRKKMSEVRKGRPMPSSVKSAHTRWHTNKNVISNKCKYCQEQ
jgi:hypothetical protein